MGILKDLLEEIQRLAAAGSNIAYEDFGLKKLLPQLKRMGESSAVFLRIAAMVEDLAGSGDNSENKLMELSSLLIAILYTQGEWEVKGEISEPDLTNFQGETCLGYRTLSPVIHALVNKGSGRYNVIKQAYEEGIFQKNDIRLVGPVMQIVNDSFNDISDFVIDNIMPIYGEPMKEALKKDFNINGTKADGRRLKAIYRLSGIEENELYEEALEKGSAEVKVAALEIFDAEKVPDEVFVEFTKDKYKQVRETAQTILNSRKRGYERKLFIYYV